VSFARVVDNLALEKSETVRSFEAWLAPASDPALDALAARARSLTRQHFGRTMRLFAPLYLSNECINSCRYCGFSRENPILRLTLSLDEVIKEAQHLARAGFRNLLLVAGEHPKFVSEDYLAECVRALREDFSSVAIEVAPMETEQYQRIVEAGAEGLVVYQETYNRAIYDEMHVVGPKRDFDWRLRCPERGYEAGFRRIGIGALFGLAPWRADAIALAAHLEYLLKRCWKAALTVSVPRLRAAAGEFHPRHPMSDRDLVQLVCALRVTFPQVGIVVSTREAPALRDLLATVGATMMSAGSRTEPGGYTHQGKERMHLTVRGRIVPPDAQLTEAARATSQFEITDARTPAEIVAVLRERGLEPVWKDWDAALTKR
jgi:2-iminoacetate synthase